MGETTRIENKLKLTPELDIELLARKVTRKQKSGQKSGQKKFAEL